MFYKFFKGYFKNGSIFVVFKNWSLIWIRYPCSWPSYTVCLGSLGPFYVVTSCTFSRESDAQESLDKKVYLSTKSLSTLRYAGVIRGNPN